MLDRSHELPLTLAGCIGTLLVCLGTVAPVLAIEFNGRLGTWSAHGYAEAYGVIRSDFSTPNQRPSGTFDVELTGDVHPKVRLYLDTRFTVGGPQQNPDGVGIYNFVDTFQNIDPAFDIAETYIDLFLGPVDVRAGLQKFAWGVLDRTQPTDVINPRRWTDPFVMSETDAKIAIPSLQASYYLPELGPRFPSEMRVTAVWVPVPISTRFPLLDERWFPVGASLPSSIFFPSGTIPVDSISLTNSVLVDIDLETENRSPPQRLDEGAAAVRLSGFAGSVDWSLYFYDGQDPNPSFDFTADLVWPEARRAADEGRLPPIPAPGDTIRLAADAQLVPHFGRIRLFGADASFEFRGFTGRFETAYGQGRLIPRTFDQLFASEDLVRQANFTRLFDGQIDTVGGALAVPRDVVQWGLGIDYLYKDITPLVQVLQRFLINNDTELLINDVDTQFLFGLRTGLLQDRLDVNVGAVFGVERFYITVNPELTYALTDHWRFRIGYLYIDGNADTIIGQFPGNSETFLQLRYSF